MSSKTIQIHATNIDGLGAAIVINELLKDLIPKLIGSYDHVIVYKSKKISQINDQSSKVTYKEYKRILPKSLSRFIEIIAARFIFAQIPTITLGDIPLRGINNQVLFIQQSNLLKKKANIYTSTQFSFVVQRFLFNINKRFIGKIIVQSNVVKNGLIKSYTIEPDRIVVQPHPISLKSYQLPVKTDPNEKLKLFYPASNYEHKNHKLIIELDNNFNLEDLASEILVTIPEPPNLRKGTIIKALGTISHQECFEYYAITNGLLFPSLMESYGLPLIEAMYVGLPIIAPKLEYAEWICGSEAIYFDPNNVESLYNAIHNLKQRVSSGWIPDYSKQLEKFPVDWDIVSATYIKAIV
jgi:glycosyltransferase involved in cell wall biosynthesis